MTELERRALLGDRQAQEECTRQGIVLPCPWCGCKKIEIRKTESIEWYWLKCGFCRAECSGQSTIELAKLAWNSRQSPPIGLCKDCENTCPGNDDSYIVCVTHGHAVHNDDWCVQFKQRKPRCKDCANWRGDELDAYAPCSDCDGVMEADNCCKNFEPKEE